MSRRSGSSRRGFTLIELVLASALGVFIVGAVFGLFVVLRASQERTRQRSDAMHELATLQSVLAQSFRTLVMLDTPPRATVRTPSVATARPADKEDPGADSKGGDKAGDKKSGKAAGPARLLLEDDDRSPFPRLEMVLANAPVAMKLADGVPAFVSGERGGGVRGAFELDPGRRPGTYDVHFRAYELSSSSRGGEDGVAERREMLADTVICRGLVKFDARFYKSGSKERGQEDRPVYDLKPLPAGIILPEDSDSASWAEIAAARSYIHLPAYVEVEAVTEQGARGRWFFEVKWMVSREQEKKPGQTASGEGDDKSGSTGRTRRGTSGSRSKTGTVDHSTIEATVPK